MMQMRFSGWILALSLLATAACEQQRVAPETPPGAADYAVKSEKETDPVHLAIANGALVACAHKFQELTGGIIYDGEHLDRASVLVEGQLAEILFSYGDAGLYEKTTPDYRWHSACGVRTDKDSGETAIYLFAENSRRPLIEVEGAVRIGEQGNDLPVTDVLFRRDRGWEFSGSKSFQNYSEYEKQFRANLGALSAKRR